MAKLTNLTNWIRDFANFVKLVMQIVQCKNLHENCEKSENSYSAERLFYKFFCISQKNVVSLHAKLRAKAKKEQAGYEYEDKDR